MEENWIFIKDKGKEILTPNKTHGRKRKPDRCFQNFENSPSMMAYLYGMPNQGTSSKHSINISPNFEEISKSSKELQATGHGYFKKVFNETIFQINQDDYELAVQPWNIKERYLGDASYPHSPSRHRMFCEVLLKELKLVKIEHHRNCADPNGSIVYSKCTINRILHHREWGMSPLAEIKIKVGSEEISCNYWGYVEAMTNVFLVNSERKHSWLIVIMPDIATRDIPAWFFSWWHRFGAEVDILPTSVRSTYKQWVESKSQIKKYQSSNLVHGQSLLQFFIEYKIPWIWTWSVEFGRDHLNIICLQRTFFIKWWSRIDENDKRYQLKAITSKNEEVEGF